MLDNIKKNKDKENTGHEKKKKLEKYTGRLRKKNKMQGAFACP